jgi:hypothetical protein
MWEYIGEKYIYQKLNNKHCSVWYDVYIKHWRWSVIVFDIHGIHMEQGICRTASKAMQCAIEKEVR